MSVCIFVPADQAGQSSVNEESIDHDGAGEEMIIIDNLQQALQQFWGKVTDDVRKINADDFKTQALPLARIKKIMKLDEDVKMISSEAPVLFAKAAEIFILELTLRAWSHTEDNKRRTLQRNDIAMAISKSDQFDFLIDIVPRNEVKSSRPREDGPRPSTSNEQVIQQQVSLSTPTQQQFVVPQYVCQPSSSQNATIVQQMVAPSAEVQQVQQLPIQLTQAQLNMIRLQVQQNPNQPIIIQTQQQNQSPQIIQVSSQAPHQGQQQVYLAQVANSQDES